MQERDEYKITFTRDQIRAARNESLTDEQCDFIAEELAGIFDEEFSRNVRVTEV